MANLSKGFIPWTAARKAKQATNWLTARERRSARQRAQAAAAARNRGLGDGQLTPWEASRATRRVRRAAARKAA